MFGLARLLQLAGTISSRPLRRLAKQSSRARLAIEELEDRVVPTLLGQQLFPADYPWNQNIVNAPVAANSAAVIAHIGSSIGIHPDWGQDSSANGSSPLYGIPVNVVHGNSVARVNVIIDNYPSESDVISVPMPANAVIEGDYQNGPNTHGGGYNANQRGDSHLIIWDEDNNIAYELYGATRPTDATLFPNTNGTELAHTDGRWHAAQESVWNMSTDSFRTLGDTSADAAGLSILAGLARPDEGLPTSQGGQGAIDHALRLTLPSGDINPQYIYPASHIVNDSSGSTKLPFGARLRLMNTPAVNAVIATLQPEAQIIAHAMQQYGLVVADIGTVMYVSGTSAAVDANNNVNLTWNMSDVLGLNALNAGDFQVVNLTPIVTGLSTTTGSAGNTISVVGQNFSGSAGHLTVLFGGVASPSVTYVDDSHLAVVIPTGSGTVHVQVQSGVSEVDPNSPTDNVNNPIFGYGTSAASAADQFTFNAQPISATNSTVAFAASTVASGVSDTLTIVVKDTSGATVSGLPNSAFSFGLSSGTSAGTFGTITASASAGTYTTAFTATTAGTLTAVTITVGGVTLSITPAIRVTVGTVSGTRSTASFAAPTVAYGNTDTITIVIKDAAGNAITGLANSAFHFSLSSTLTASGGTFGTVTETATPGTYTAVFAGVTAGTASALTVVVNNITLAALPTVTVSPPTATLPFSENFAAVNYPSNPGSQLSSYWRNRAGDLSLVNGNATGQAAINLAMLNGISQANVSVQAAVNVAAGQFAGLVARYQGAGDQNMYFGTILANGSNYVAQIYVNHNGTWTLLASHSIGITGQGTLLFTAIGSSLQLLWQPNGTNGFSLVASATDGSLTTGSVGVRVSQNAKLVNFTATVATAPTPQNATLPFSENFAAVNYPGNPGSQLSSYWRNRAGDLSLVNGNATGQAAINLAMLNGISQANVSVQAAVNVAAGQFAGLVARYQGAGDQNMYFGTILANGSNYVAQIYVNHNGTWTLLASHSIGITGQGTLLFTAIGSSLQLLWQPNGTNGFSLVASATDGSLTTGSVGVRVSQNAKLVNFTAA